MKSYTQRELAEGLRKGTYLSRFGPLNMPEKGDIVVHRQLREGTVIKVGISDYVVKFTDLFRTQRFVVGENEDISKVEDLDFYQQLKEACKPQKQRRPKSIVGGTKVTGICGLKRELRRGLLTFADVKEILGLTGKELSKILKSGKLPSRKIRSKTYIKEADLENWAKQELRPK